MAVETLNIAIIPHKDDVSEALKITSTLKVLGELFFVIDNKTFFPHITLYATDYSESKINDLIQRLEELCKKTSKFEVSWKDLHSRAGYFDIQTDKDKQLSLLQKKVVTLASPFRKQLTLLDRASIKASKDFSLAQKNNILKYGFSDVGSLFRPHMTFCRFKHEEDGQKACSKISWNQKKLRVSEIGLFRSGDHGTCVECVSSFHLV